MSRTKYQESIRRSTILPTFSQSLAEVHFHPHADFASLQVFTCDRLSCVLTKEACAANYTRTNAPISCKGCPIGVAHAGGKRYRNEPGIHTASELALGLSCIRCERNSLTATRYIARFRLVKQHTLCLNCFNREREVAKGSNAKGAKPVRWAHLQQATITIEDAAGERKTLDIGLRTDYLECARYLERVHPGATLIKTAIGGEIIPQFSLWTPLPFSPWEPGMVRDEKPSKPKRTYIHRGTPRTGKKTNAAASPVDWDDWDTPLYKLGKPVESDESDADSSRQARHCGWLPPKSEEDDAAYCASFEEGDALDPESIAAYWDPTGGGLPEFIEWLTDAWPVFDIKPAEPSAPVADNGAAAEIAKPASDRVCPVADAVSNHDPIADEDTESEWEGCSLTRGDETICVTDYAREHGISDEDAAIELGMCDPENSDEPQAINSVVNLKREVCAKRTNEPAPKKLTGKQQRKLEKAARRAERQQAPRQPAAPADHSAPSIAQTAKAFVHVLMSGQLSA